MARKANFWASLRRWNGGAWCRGGYARKRSVDDRAGRVRLGFQALAGRDEPDSRRIAFCLTRLPRVYCLNKRGVRVEYASHGVNNVSNQYPKSRSGQRVPARKW